jgi:hypothetical protein
MNFVVAWLVKKGLNAQLAGGLVRLALIAVIIGLLAGAWQWQWQRGYSAAQAGYEIAIEKQKDEAKLTLQIETRKVEIAQLELKTKTQNADYEHKKTLDQMRSDHAALPKSSAIRLYDPGRRQSSCSTNNATATGIGISELDATGAVELSAAVTEFLVAEADHAKLALAEVDAYFSRCVADVRLYRAAIENRKGKPIE